MLRRNLIGAALVGGAGALMQRSADAQLRDSVFVGRLLGSEEVPPVSSRATGVCTARLDPRGHKMDVELNVFNITNVTQVHFHLGARGQNGPVVVRLYGYTPGAGPERGRLLCRTITDADVTLPDEETEKAGDGKLEFAEFVRLMYAGQIYVNVHTAGAAGGEIRAQMQGRIR